MAITINDVAKRAKVSPSTVSKAMKNYPGISASTKARVFNAIKELNYTANVAASSLSSKNVKKIALLIHINDSRQQIDEVNMHYLLGAFDKASELDIQVLTIFTYSISKLNKNELIQYLKSQGVTGIAVYGLNKENKIIHEIIKEKIFKMVVIDAPISNDWTSSVYVDQTEGQYAVAKKILNKDYIHNVLYLAGKKNGYITDMRIQGIQRLQNELGFNLNIQYADFSEKRAYELTKQYGDSVQAIVCASDLMAIGAIKSLKSMDIYREVCGFDGIGLMAYTAPNVYTCVQDFSNVSSVAIEEMNNLFEGKKGRRIILDYRIDALKYEDVVLRKTNNE